MAMIMSDVLLLESTESKQIDLESEIDNVYKV